MALRGSFLFGVAGDTVEETFKDQMANDNEYKFRYDLRTASNRRGEHDGGAKGSDRRQLEKLGVDVIEAGFAASSDGDFESVRRVAQEVSQPRVVSLARAQEGDINRALKAVEGAKKPGIHTFIATSDIHLKHKLRMTREQVVEAAVKAVSYAKQFTDYVEFSAEDASRSDPEFCCKFSVR